MQKKSHIEAVDRYNKKTYDQIRIRIRKEETGIIKAAAKGRSMNAFILEAIREKIEREAPPEIEREKFTD